MLLLTVTVFEKGLRGRGEGDVGCRGWGRAVSMGWGGGGGGKSAEF
jgi:hypothetical protein